MISKVLKLVTAMIIQVFHHSFHQFAKTVAFVCPFGKFFSLLISGKIVGKVTLIGTSSVPHNFVQNSCIPKSLFCEFVFFALRSEHSSSFPSKRTRNSVIPVLSANSISGAIQDLLFQKSTELKMEDRKNFT